MGVGTISGPGRTLRVGVVALTGAVVAGTLGSPANSVPAAPIKSGTTTSSATTAERTARVAPAAASVLSRGQATDWVPNAGCADGSSGWVPSAASWVRSLASTPHACEVAVRPEAGTVSAVSRPSGGRVAQAGSLVQVSGQVDVVNGTRPVSLTLQEVTDDGTVLASSTGSRDAVSDWSWLGAKLHTKRAGSRIRVFYRMPGQGGSQALRFRAATTSVTAATSTSTKTCNDLNDATKRTLAFSDEFNGTSIDSRKWRVRDNAHLSFDAAYLTKNAVKVSNGSLRIEGRRRSSPATASNGLRQRWYNTGYLDSIGTFSQKYGRWEIRAKLPTSHTMARGVWPAFWLRADKTAGEIDIMEAYGGQSTQKWNPAGSYTSTLWENTNLGRQRGEWFSWAHKNWSTITPGVYNAFHVYGVNWTPDCIQFTLDDKVMSSVALKNLPWTKTAFNSTFNMRLNMQVGSSYWGMPDRTHTKDAFDYIVDNVRVYKMNP